MPLTSDGRAYVPSPPDGWAELGSFKLAAVRAMRFGPSVPVVWTRSEHAESTCSDEHREWLRDWRYLRVPAPWEPVLRRLSCRGREPWQALRAVAAAGLPVGAWYLLLGVGVDGRGDKGGGWTNWREHPAAVAYAAGLAAAHRLGSPRTGRYAPVTKPPPRDLLGWKEPAR